MSSGGNEHADHRPGFCGDDEPLLLDGFETALTGLTQAGPWPTIRTVGVYDLGQCFEILLAHGMSDDEAADCLLRSFVGWSNVRTEGKG